MADRSTIGLHAPKGLAYASDRFRLLLALAAVLLFSGRLSAVTGNYSGQRLLLFSYIPIWSRWFCALGFRAPLIGNSSEIGIVSVFSAPPCILFLLEARLRVLQPTLNMVAMLRS